MKFLIVDKRKRVGDLTTPHYAVARLQETLDKKKIDHDFCHFDELTLNIVSGELEVRAKERPLDEYTHIIFRGHRSHYEYQMKLYTVMYAESKGIRVQNSELIKKIPHYNKLYQMALLSQAGIPCIDSYYSVDGKYHEKKEALNSLGFPLIYKHTEGEYRTEMIDGKEKLKKNVFLVNNVEELKEEIERREDLDDIFLGKDSHYFIQKFVDIGEDYRAIMLGGKYLSGWKRVAPEGSHITVTRGSEYSLYDKPTPEFLKLATEVTTLFQADYFAPDIIYVGGKPYIIEINMEPGFKAFETKIEGCNVDVADAMVENLLNT